MTQPTVRFHDLDRAAIDAVLARNHVGRLAYTFRDRVDIRPIAYLYEGGWLHCRTTPGGKLDTLAHHPWVAFEVDEIDGPFDWRSVVVQGFVYTLRPDTADADAYQQTVTVLRSVLPTALTEHDPTPERNVIFRIDIRSVSGRAATTQPDSRTP